MPYADKDAQRRYQLEWINRRRHEWINRRRHEWIEANGPCRICGSSESMEVDHVDPKVKKMDPARIWGLSAKKRTEELAKCQVLCGTCHSKKTAKELAFVPPHGTRARYARKDEHKCRCDLCRAAAAAYAREWRRKAALASRAS